MTQASAMRASVLVLLIGCGADDAASSREPELARKQQALALHQSSLSRELSRDPANLKHVQLTNGIRAVRIESGFRHVTMVAVDRDGGVRRGCVDELPPGVAQ
jgi:hypothetical protein